MLTQESSFNIQEINGETKTISIIKFIIVKDDGIEIARSSNTCGFVPGQIEDVKKYIGQENCPEIAYLQSIWTQDAIDAYNKSLEQ